MSSALQKKSFGQAQTRDFRSFLPHQELSRLFPLGGALKPGRVVAWSSGDGNPGVLGFSAVL